MKASFKAAWTYLQTQKKNSIESSPSNLSLFCPKNSDSLNYLVFASSIRIIGPYPVVYLDVFISYGTVFSFFVDLRSLASIRKGSEDQSNSLTVVLASVNS